MTTPDAELLQEFARDHSEEVFATLVSRHVDLVYSVALRQVRSPQLAQDVAQTVFIDLSRNADKLAPATILTAWLYRVTRRTAIDVVRSESRRQLREQIAVELATMNLPDSHWTQIEPLLDEAMDTLDDADRSSILLRYFENKSLREVGQTLGTAADAAQKRVSRAVERLREFFSKRGVTVGASGLAVVISANAVQAAPIGFALTISSGLAGTITTAALATQITMNWLTTKTITAILGSALVAGTGTYVLLQNQTNRLRKENHDLIAAQEKLNNERDAAVSATTGNNDEFERLRKEKIELIRLRSEVGILRKQVSELGKLQEQTQKNQIASVAQIQVIQSSEEESKLLKFEGHRAATFNAMKQLGLAIRMYAGDHKDQYATNFDQMLKEIREIFSGDVELDRFEFVNAGLVNETMGEILTFREKTPRQTPGGKWERGYTLANGSVQMIESLDGNFDEFEKPRIVTPSK